MLEELKNLQGTVGKLQSEIKQLRAEIKNAETLREDATKKYVKAFTTAYLDAVVKRERVDAAGMLSKSLRTALDRDDLRQEYAAPLGYAGKGFDGAVWKSWSVDAHDWAPNLKAVIIKGQFQGEYEKKAVSLPFALHLGHEMESDQWRVCLFRIDFKK
jgi:hypothetical protein